MSRDRMQWRRGEHELTSIPASGDPVRSVISFDHLAALLDIGSWTAEVNGQFHPDVENPSWYWVDDALLLELMAAAGWELL